MFSKIKLGILVASVVFPTISFAQSAVSSWEGRFMFTIESELAGSIGGETREIGDSNTVEITSLWTPNILVDGAYFLTPQLAVKGVFGVQIMETETKLPTVLGGTTTEEKSTDFEIGVGINYSFDRQVIRGAYAEILALYRVSSGDTDSSAFGGLASIGYRVSLANNFSWSPSFDFGYAVGEVNDSDLTATRWNVSLIKFDFFM